MRKKFFQLMPAFILSCCVSSYGQALKTDTTTVLKRAQTVYFELLGNGAVYSFNYDTRFKAGEAGPGIRVGLGYYATTGENIFSAPVAFNYLAGKKGKYFEFGAGLTYYSTSENSFLFIEEQNYDSYYSGNSSSGLNGLLGTLIFGYRSQPADGGYTFRAGVSPIIAKGTFIPYWPYISFGYKF